VAGNFLRISSPGLPFVPYPLDSSGQSCRLDTDPVAAGWPFQWRIHAAATQAIKMATEMAHLTPGEAGMVTAAQVATDVEGADGSASA
jgi:hypothetical protein